MHSRQFYNYEKENHSIFQMKCAVVTTSKVICLRSNSKLIQMQKREKIMATIETNGRFLLCGVSD